MAVQRLISSWLAVLMHSTGDGIRTLEKGEFSKIKSELLDGAVKIPAPKSYLGKTLQRPDGSVVGVRNSEEYGETLEVIKSVTDKIFENGYKVRSK